MTHSHSQPRSHSQPQAQSMGIQVEGSTSATPRGPSCGAST